MQTETTVPLSEAVAIAIVCGAVFAIIACLIMRRYMLMGFRMERIQGAVEYLHGLFARRELEALRSSEEDAGKIFARTGSRFFEIRPARHDRLAPETFGHFSEEELTTALDKLRRDKRYEEVDWHEDEGKEFRELRLRPEFLGDDRGEKPRRDN